jgi:TatD DNase family protein
MLVDSHCHLDFDGLVDNLDAVLARADAARVGLMVTVSTHVRKFDQIRAIAESRANIVCSIGTHPHHAAEEPDITADDLVRIAEHPKVAAIGEAGLDYFYKHSPVEAQQASFRQHIAAARRTGLPLIIHSRDADEDMIAILRDEMDKGVFPALVHCFTSGPELAQAAVELGLYISFSGVLTFKKTDALRDIASTIPLDRLLVETDAPYLSPEPVRGSKNEPSYVRHTARVLARVKGVSEAEIERTTTDNFYRLFTRAPVQAVRCAAS